MKLKELEKINKLSSEIENFNDCYSDCVLWSRPPDGDVNRDDLLIWMLNNIHMAEIAVRISKLRS